MVICSTVAYVIGFCLLYASSHISNQGKATILFYLALLPIAIRHAGQFEARSFFWDQMVKKDPNQLDIDWERVDAHVQFWFVLNNFFGGAVVATLVLRFLEYSQKVEDYWKRIFLISTIVMAISCFIFTCGFRWYYHREPSGSPLTDVCVVVNAAIRKRHWDYPSMPQQFYSNDGDEVELLPNIAVLSVPQRFPKLCDLKQRNWNLWNRWERGLFSTLPLLIKFLYFNFNENKCCGSAQVQECSSSPEKRWKHTATGSVYRLPVAPSHFCSVQDSEDMRLSVVTTGYR